MSKSIAVDNNVTAHASVRTLLGKIQTNLCDFVFNTPGLTIGSSSKPKVKIANTTYAFIDGVLVKKTTAEITLSGTVVNATFNVFVLTMTADGTVTATMGTAGATIGAVVFPATPASSVVLGFAIVNPTGTGNFVGGTTDLDDATVVPNAVYTSTPFPFNYSTQSL